MLLVAAAVAMAVVDVGLGDAQETRRGCCRHVLGAVDPPHVL